ncbi:hypothetical protein PAPYR_11682 [Paratrimastix pyriformis]|uniref:Uncharacterized protein n=1 Tax=Paratrimastix pyriformis TaxID=342808 RepID=A0ABQ8UAC8_9EUKA|nr:hypothetical protein PAPYR_11682 [Paratrimastix pyriformis]
MKPWDGKLARRRPSTGVLNEGSVWHVLTTKGKSPTVKMKKDQKLEAGEDETSFETSCFFQSSNPFCEYLHLELPEESRAVTKGTTLFHSLAVSRCVGLVYVRRLISLIPNFTVSCMHNALFSPIFRAGSEIMDLFHSFAHLHHPVWYPSTSVFTLGTSSPGLRQLCHLQCRHGYFKFRWDGNGMDFTHARIPDPRVFPQEEAPAPGALHHGLLEHAPRQDHREPHPYTTNWQTMVSVPNARRQAVDRDDNRLLLPCTRPALTSSTIRTWLT